MKEQLPAFIESFTGKDLKDVVEKEADSVMLRMLKKEKKHSDSSEALSKSFSYTIQKKQNLKITMQRYSTPPALPWNGWYGDTELTNTCTIDNMIYTFHILQVENEEFCNYMKDSDSFVNRTLYSIHECFLQKKWSEGKFIWIDQILKLPLHNRVDLFGGEDVNFFNHINNDQATAYKSVCSNDQCPEKVSLKVNRVLGFSQPSNTIQNLQDGIIAWIMNEKQLPCNKHDCNGIRRHHKRQFVSGSVPRYFALELSLCPWSASLPLTLNIMGHLYHLKAATYGNGHHFNASVSFKGRWYFYDGLREYHSPGSGIK